MDFIHKSRNGIELLFPETMEHTILVQSRHLGTVTHDC